MNPAFKFAHHLARGRDAGWHPFLAVYYLTYRCDFRCPYCSDGAQTPYYELRSKVLPAADVLRLLGRIRRHCEHLVLTGGEPLLHPEVDAVMRGVGELGFSTVVFTTNGYWQEGHLEAVASGVTHLVFSLDTLDAAKADAWYGVGEGALKRILGSIEAAASRPGRRHDIVISSVVTPDNIADLYEVYRYCKERRFRFAACPQLVGVKPHEALRGNEEYRRFYDHLLAEKKRGEDIQGTVLYLEHMRDLPKFACRPFTMLTVAPTGEVFYPCLELGQFAGNLFEFDDLQDLKRAAREKFGGLPQCGNQCHSACALGFATLLDRPQSAVSEGWLMLKGAVRRA